MGSDIHNRVDPHVDLQDATRRHRRIHTCGAYTFEDGAHLYQCVRDLQPHRVLELGCALGYTACTMATASPKAHILTVESDAEHVCMAREAIAAKGLSQRIEVRYARFESVLAELPDQGFDLVFFDGYEPHMAILGDIARVLVPMGHFICSNTQLSQNPRALSHALAQSFRDLQNMALEAGRTRVLQRLDNSR